VLLIAAVFVAGMAASMGRLSRPWWDEVQGAEVAANLLTGRGFTSAASLIQDRYEFYAANGPLFHVLMFGWLKLFGLSVVAVRTFGYVLAAITALAVWAAVARLGIVQRPSHRVLLMVLLLCGLSMGRVYLNNRYDAPGIALAALLFLASTLADARYRLPCLLLGGMLLPFFGIQFAPYAGLIALVGFWLHGRSFWRDSAAVVVGLALGLVGVVLVWHAQGVLSTFSRGARFDVPAARGPLARLGNLFDAVFVYQRNDTLILATGLGLCLLMQATPQRLRSRFRTSAHPPTIPAQQGKVEVVKQHLSRRSTLWLGIAASVGIPAAMALVGRYSGVYVWMAFVPVAICAVAALERELAASRVAQTIMYSAIAAACVVGVPAKIGLSATEWEARDAIRLERYVRQYIHPDDRVYCTFAAYYAAKTSAADVWTGCGWTTMSAEDRDRLTLVVVEPGAPGATDLPEGPWAATVLRSLRGDWQLVGSYVTRRGRMSELFWPSGQWGAPLAPEIFHLDIYRKQQ
jgi:hypothetical protein